MSSDLRVLFTLPPTGVRIEDRSFRGGSRRRPEEARDGAEERSDSAPSPSGAEDSGDEGGAAREDAAGADASPEEPSAAPVAPREGPPPAWKLQMERLDRILLALEEAVSRMEERLRVELSEIEPQIVRLAVAAAEAVLLRELSDQGRGGLERLVRAAVERVGRGLKDGVAVEVRLHPDDLDGLKERFGREPGAVRARLRGDADVPPGRAEVRAELRRIWIDARAELGRIADLLLGEGQEAETEPDAPADAAREGGDE